MNTKAFRNISYRPVCGHHPDKKTENGLHCQQRHADNVGSPTLAVSLNHENYTNPCIKKTVFRRFYPLGSMRPEAYRQFGFRSGKDTDKFEGVDFETAAALPVISTRADI
jgi:hypothetical protein